LIEAAVRAFQSKSLDQFDITGDNIAISSGPAIALSMVIHELCTNAVKYGALSARAGHVSISWAVSQDDSKRLSCVGKKEAARPSENLLVKASGLGLLSRPSLVNCTGKLVSCLNPMD
jgi:two-component sensor histidine kinase